MNSPGSAACPDFQYAGARALVILHDQELRKFLEVWRLAKQRCLTLPKTADPDYATLDTLLRHVCGAARGYMVWCCKQLELPDPGIELTPDAAVLEAQVDRYIDHVLDRWRDPLRGVDGERFDRPEYASSWGTQYCIDAMLEHAVMHPLRHRFQLQELMSPE